MAKADQIKWNQRYLKGNFVREELKPAKWLKSHLALIQTQAKGKALDMACGMGRNSFYLASLGFKVDAWDISDVAISWIQENKKGFAIQPETVDLDLKAFPIKHYELLLDFYFLDRALFPKMKMALKPGGLIFFETWSHLQKNIKNSSTPAKFYLGEGELLQAFAEFEIIDYQEKKINGKGKASLLARKPGRTGA